MRSVVHNSIEIHWSENHLFGFSTIVQKNRMIQIASCGRAFKTGQIESELMKSRASTKLHNKKYQFIF